MKWLTLSFTSARLLFPSSICSAPSNAFYQSRVTGCFGRSSLASAVKEKSNNSSQTDRPGRTEKRIICSFVRTFLSLTCLHHFRKTFIFHFYEILSRPQQCCKFALRVFALILTGSCDRLPTAVRVTHCRPDCIINAQQPSAADSAVEWDRFSPTANQSCR